MGGIIFKKFFTKKIIFLLLIFFLQFITNIFIVGNIYLDQVRSRIESRISFVKQDVRFRNENWDLSRYNADPNLLEKFPLYLIALDGNIIDRRNPIHGFLDQSDFNFLLQFNSFQTLTSANGTKRRVHARPLLDNNKTIGVVAVSFFNPQNIQISEIDAKLEKTLDELFKNIQVKNGLISVERVDERDIPYNVSFTIVDRYNIVLKKTTNVNSFNRIPTSLDSSYLRSLVNNNQFQLIRDIQTHEFFLVKTSHIKDKNSSISGVLVVGQSLTQYIILFGKNIFLSSFLLIITSFFVFWWIGFSGEFTFFLKRKTYKISFDEKNSTLIIGNEKISIPYSTNQFYMLQALFRKPEKRWETDELLERFGEEGKQKNSRKIYDTMVKLNLKIRNFTPEKFIINEHKTYKLNTFFKIQKKM